MTEVMKDQHAKAIEQIGQTTAKALMLAPNDVTPCIAGACAGAGLTIIKRKPEEFVVVLDENQLWALQVTIKTAIDNIPEQMTRTKMSALEKMAMGMITASLDSIQDKIGVAE